MASCARPRRLDTATPPGYGLKFDLGARKGITGNPVQIGSGPAAVSSIKARPHARHWEISREGRDEAEQAGRPTRIMALPAGNEGFCRSDSGNRATLPL